MPWTFAHPAAVLPLKRFTPKHLDFPALVAGSLCPDICYYLRWEIGSFTHTFWGGIVACVPFGIALLALFFGLRWPVCRLLPRRHRTALLGLAPSSGFVWSFPHIARVLGSIILGAWSHDIWDAFTHKTGFFVQWFPVLRGDLFLGLPVFYWLQQLSSVLGALLLVGAYSRWLRGVPFAPVAQGENDRWRFWLWGAVGGLSSIVGFALAFRAVGALHGGYALRVFLFQFAIYGTAAFGVLTVGCALWLELKRS